MKRTHRTAVSSVWTMGMTGLIVVILIIAGMTVFGVVGSSVSGTRGGCGCSNKEGFASATDNEEVFHLGDDLLAPDAYPRLNRGLAGFVPDRTNADNWWHYPVFRLGSYDQITNNIRFPNNPDNGTCTRSEFCGALYRDAPHPTNYVYPLPPVKECSSCTRIGYFNTTARTSETELLEPRPPLVAIP